jgi:hypothetical protein
VLHIDAHSDGRQQKRQRSGPARITGGFTSFHKYKLNKLFGVCIEVAGNAAREPGKAYSDDSTGSLLVTRSGKIPMLAAATASRLVFLTRYMASSARCRSPSLVFESTG